MFGGNKPTSLFGGTNPTNTFGQTSSPFGQPQQPTSLFGQQNSTTAFGQQQTQQTSLFGTPPRQTGIFGGSGVTASPFAATQASNAFGQTNQAATGLFAQQSQSANTFGSTPPSFGTSSTGLTNFGQNMTGTVIKFNAVAGTDTMLKNGSTTTIGTRHQCLTAMKEYEGKSIEELRFEDYSANRKGPQQQGFGVSAPSNAFSFTNPAVSQTTSAFGATTASTSLFGNQSKPTAFGLQPLQPAQSTSSLFPSTSSPFGQQQNNPIGFGQQTTTASLFSGGLGSQNQPQTSLFSTQQPVPSSFGLTSSAPTSTAFNFGSTTPAKSLFGQTQTTGTTSLFGQQPQQQTPFGSLTASQPKSLFGATSTGFALNQTTSSSAFPSFGTNSTQTTTSTSLFGQQPQQQTAAPFSFSNPASSKPNFSLGTTNTFQGFGSTVPASTSLFGQPTQTNPIGGSFNFGGASVGSSLFGTANQQPQPFSFNNTSQTTSFQQLNYQPQQSDSIKHELLISRLRTLPYGTNPLFQNDTASLASMACLPNKTKFTTDSRLLMHYRTNAKESEIKRVPVNQNNNGVKSLFADVDEEEGKLCSADFFKPRSNVKKLVIKAKDYILPSEPDSSTDIKTISDEHEGLIIRPQDLNRSVTPVGIDSTVMEFEANRKKDDWNTSPSTIKGFRCDSGDERESSFIQEKQQKPLKCGLIQSRLDYYTIPKYQDIDCFFDDEKNSCIVDSFTIGRKGFGSIFWDCPVDLYRLNLDEIIHIRRKEVIVYPDDEDKPEVGRGLNLPAQITLDQVWPIDKDTKEIIKDVEKLQEMRYAERLEAVTAKQGAIFKDYRPETGSWVFNVKHFSKYGLKDDDDDEPMPSPPKQINEGIMEKISVSTVTQDTHVISHFSTPFEQIFSSFAKPEDFVYKGPARGVLKEAPVTQADHFEGMRNALFEEEAETDLSLEEIDHQRRTSVGDWKPLKKQRYSSLHSKSPVVQDVVEISPKTGERHYLRSDKTSQKPSKNLHFLQPQLHIKKRDIKYLTNQVPLLNKSMCDIASFKLTPSHKARFIESGSGRYMIINGNQVTLYSAIQDQKYEEESQAEYPLQERMQVQLKKLSVVKGTNTIPLIETRKKIVNSMNPGSLNLLILALYGDITKPDGGLLTPYEEEESRRNCLIDWLSNKNKASIRIPSDPMRRVLYYLSINDVKAACDEAIKSQNLTRLALLISCGLCTFSRDEALSQLDSWKESRADAFIQLDLLRMFILISGLIHWTISTGQVVSAVEDLEWSQELVLNLIYNQETGLEECISSLDPTQSDSLDFHLILNLYGDQWLTLEKCDSFEESWFLHQSLIAFNALPYPSVASDALHGQFVSRLIHSDVMWASFISLHIVDDHVRKRTLKQVLGVNAQSIGEQEQDFLVNFLMIEEKDIESAKATYFKSTFNAIEEAKSLMKAGNFSQSHDILLHQVFPDLVIQGETQSLKELLNHLKKGQESISNWFTSGAHIYDVYCCCLSGEINDDTLSSMNPINLFGLKTPSHRHSLARSEMITKILSVLEKKGSMETQSEKADSSNKGIGDKASSVSHEQTWISLSSLVSAPIPDDSVISQLYHKTNDLLDNLLDSNSRY